MADREVQVSIPATEVVTDLRKVNDHLASLYRRIAGAEVTGGVVPVARALLLNLVIYARTEGEAEHAAVNVSEIAGTHPCRAIILEAIPPQPGEPHAVLSAVCGITERGDRQLCGEIITIHVTPGRSEVASSVLPLLVPDVPVFVWVPGEIPVDDEDFEALVSMADRVILDSRKFQDLAEGLRLVPRFCPHDSVTCTVTDLSWMSLQPWRELAAQHFDPPHSRRYLANIERIDVSFARGEREGAPPSSPLLLAAWFMGRTGTETRSVEHVNNDALLVRARQDDHAVEVHLSPTGRGLAPGSVGALVVRGNVGGQRGTFIVKSVSMTGVVVTEECPGVCLPPQELELPPLPEAVLAAQAMGSPGRDEIYEETLATAVDIMTTLGGSSGRVEV